MSLLATTDIWSGLIQAGFGALCLLLIAILFWVIKRLFGLLKNDLAHLDESTRGLEKAVSNLPCKVAECPAEK